MVEALHLLRGFIRHSQLRSVYRPAPLEKVAFAFQAILRARYVPPAAVVAGKVNVEGTYLLRSLGESEAGSVFITEHKMMMLAAAAGVPVASAEDLRALRTRDRVEARLLPHQDAIVAHFAGQLADDFRWLSLQRTLSPLVSGGAAPLPGPGPPPALGSLGRT